MTLPNYFLADLPPEATLSGSMIREACQTLKRNRECYLAGRSTSHLVKVISETAANWLAEDYPIRQLALEQGPQAFRGQLSLAASTVSSDSSRARICTHCSCRSSAMHIA